MFIQPCCQFIGQGTAAGAVVVGLVASDTLRAEGMAISPTLLVIASLLVALAVLTWPFVSIAMPGPRKRVTRWDALQLGFSGTVGLAIATILAVTAVQCAQLENDVEGQLTALAGELDQELTAEITSSARTLDALEAWLATCPSDPGPQSIPAATRRITRMAMTWPPWSSRVARHSAFFREPMSNSTTGTSMSPH